MSAALKIPHRMTVAEFQDWVPPREFYDHRWILVDGEPVCMSPPSVTHAAMQGEAVLLLGNHLRATRPSCHVLVTPGVIPRILSQTNERSPDLAVTCSPIGDEKTVENPVLVIEILSPTNEPDTRRNVWAYASIPSVQEILLLNSTSIGAELFRREAEGAWPPDPFKLGAEDMVELNSIGFSANLLAFYAGTRFAAR